MNPISIALLFPVIPAAYHYAFLWALQGAGNPFTSKWFGLYLGLAVPVSMLFSAFRWTCLKAISGVQPGRSIFRMGFITLIDLIFLTGWLGCLSICRSYWPENPWILVVSCLVIVLVLRWINAKIVLSIFLRTRRSLTQPIRFSRSFVLILPICVMLQISFQGMIMTLFHHLGPLQNTLLAYSGTLYLFYAVESLSLGTQCHFLMHSYPHGVTHWVPTRRA